MAAVVLTVKVEVPEPAATEVGFSEQTGGRFTTGAMLQVRATALLKPFSGATVIVDVPDPPAEIAAGEKADAAMVKSGVPVAIRVATAVCVRAPEVPVTVMV